MRFSVKLGMLLCLASQPAFASTDDGQFSVKGVGNYRCEKFTTDLTNPGSPQVYMYGGWIYGYLTGDNRYAQETFDLVTWGNLDTLTNYVHSYCQQNPQHTFGVAVLTLADALRETRLTQKSPPIELETEHGRVRVYLATLVRAQKALYDEGYYDSPPDGAYGPKTRAAIEAFQRKEMLTISGLLDQETLHSLLRNE